MTHDFLQSSLNHQPVYTMGFGREKEASANATKIGFLEDRIKQFDDMLKDMLGRIVDRIEALESGKKFEDLISHRLTEFNTSQSHHDAEFQEAVSQEGTVGDLKAIEDRLTYLEDEARRNKEYIQNSVTVPIEEIKHAMEQSEKKVEHFEKTLEDMKVACENSNSQTRDLLLSKVETVEENLMLIQENVTKVEANLEETNVKLDVIDAIKGDLEDNVKLDILMMKSNWKNSESKFEALKIDCIDANLSNKSILLSKVEEVHQKVESTKEDVKNVEDNLEKMKDDANSLRSLVGNFKEDMENNVKLDVQLMKRNVRSNDDKLDKLEKDRAYMTTRGGDEEFLKIQDKLSKFNDIPQKVEKLEVLVLNIPQRLDVLESKVLSNGVKCLICDKRTRTQVGMFKHYAVKHENQLSMYPN